MPVTVQQNESRWVIRLEGQVNIASAAELKTLLLDWLAAGKDLELDLDTAEDIDITVLQLLWAAGREASRVGLGFAGHASTQTLLAMQNAGFDQMPGFHIPH